MISNVIKAKDLADINNLRWELNLTHYNEIDKDLFNKL